MTFSRHSTPRGRRGMSLLEVIVALSILAVSLIGMAEYGRRLSRTNANSSLLNRALDLAQERVERVKAERNYTSMDTLAIVENTIVTVPPGLYPGYRRTTTISRTNTSQVDYKTVTVTITHPAMGAPVKKTTAIARF
jgi:prepilin-type N-terminal cleavage/methylation domain-containing protein